MKTGVALTTGVFFGEDIQNGIRLSIFDFAPPQKQHLIRLIAAADETARSRAVSVCAQVTPYESEAVLWENGICIKKDTDCFCFGNKETKNWENRYCRIRFCGGNRIIGKKHLIVGGINRPQIMEAAFLSSESGVVAQLNNVL